MKYFKSASNEIYAYESDGSQDHLITDAKKNKWKELTDEELSAIINPPKSSEQIQLEINNASRAYLLSTDWYVIRNTETGEPIPEEISTKRNDARASVKD